MLISESTWERKAHPVQRNQNFTVEMFFKEIGISMSHIVSLTSKKQEKKSIFKKMNVNSFLCFLPQVGVALQCSRKKELCSIKHT